MRYSTASLPRPRPSTYSQTSEAVTTPETMVVRSYTEHKVTILMIAIAVLYVLGNLPMALNMLVFRHSITNDYHFQVPIVKYTVDN